MSTQQHTPTPFDTFYANKTPANAVALARADHRAHSGQNASEFLDALTKAENQCRSHDALVAALRVLLDQCDYTAGACSLTDMVGAAIPSVVIDRARAALAAAGEPA